MTEKIIVKPSEDDVEVSSINKPQKQTKIKRNAKLPLEQIDRYNPSYKAGLTNEQVDTRNAEGYNNYIKDKNVKTYRSIFFSNIFTFFNLLCFLVAGALIVVGAYSNIVFMVVVLANIVIGIFQEIRAKQTIQKIKLVTSPQVKVVRNGKIYEILVNDVVLDDIVTYDVGKQISSDAIVVEGEIEVNESLLTGESNPIKKKKGDLILSGSFVVSGSCFAKVEKVGGDSYSAQLAGKAKEYKKAKSELLKSLKIIIKGIGILIIPIAILMFFNNWARTGNDLIQTIKNTAALIIGMIPAGMFLLTSVALAVGVIKLAKKRTLVQDLYSIEMLARVDVLCLDKTGTITDGTMKVTELKILNNQYENRFNEIIGSMLTALNDNNQTSRALISKFGYSKAYSPQEVLPFSSSRKLSAVTFKSGNTFILGAPEFVLKTKDKELDSVIKSYASRGLRVLMVAQSNGQIVNDKLPANRTPIALIVIEDHIREDAERTIKWFKENGVEIKIISGDNPITVSEVSKRVGVEHAEKYINLEGLNEQQVIDAADKYTVFGRVTPEQKCYLIKAIKSKGKMVAMTGDGVNDILALKEADCSIAMASGSEATRLVSHLVLLDSNFSSMPSVVAEGRRVVNNVQNSSSLFLMKTIFTILLCVFCLAVQTVYPFITLHVMLLEFCVIGIPSFFLALQPSNEKINGKFLSNLLAKSLPAAILFFLGVASCYFLFTAGIVSEWEYITMASLTITATGLVVLYRICKPFDLYKGVMFTAMLVLVVLLLSIVPREIFEYSYISLQNALFIIVFVQASYPIYSTLVRICDSYLKKEKQ